MSGQGGWGSGNLNQFSVGRFAMAITGHWSLIAFGQAYHQQMEYLEKHGIKEDDIKDHLEKPLRIGAVLIPHFAGHPPSYRVSSRVAGINAKSPRREDALYFLQYLAGPTYSKLLNEGADFLPGNPKYAQLGVEPGPPALSRPELQKATEEAMTHGYSPRRSPFLLTSDITRIIAAQISRLESDPRISTEALLGAAESDLNTLMRRNLERNPDLKKLYIERFGEASYKSLR
jgi:ABC-type glycerol-3-phosphate transport system substrate-binding protein